MIAYHSCPNGFERYDDTIKDHRTLLEGTRIQTKPISFSGFPTQPYYATIVEAMEEYSTTIAVRFDDDHDDDDGENTPSKPYVIRRDQVAWVEE